MTCFNLSGILRLCACSCLLTLTGCASFFGPYFPAQKNYTELVSDGRPTQGKAGKNASEDTGPAGSKEDSVETAYHPEFDSTNTARTDKPLPNTNAQNNSGGSLSDGEPQPIANTAGLNQSQPAALRPDQEDSAVPLIEQNPFAQNPFAQTDSPETAATDESTLQENPFAVMAREEQQIPDSASDAAETFGLLSQSATEFDRPAGDSPAKTFSPVSNSIAHTPTVAAAAHGAGDPKDVAGVAFTRGNAVRTASAVIVQDAQPRLPTAQPGCPVPDDCTIAASPLAQAYPDEYIFDGGDRDHPVHYYGGEMEGLDTEDTVAEFKDHEGGNHVKPSNRVAVYAPRFGAVETVSGLEIDVKVDKAAGATEVSGAGTLLEGRGMQTGITSTPASGLAARRSASGMLTSRPGHQSQASKGPALSSKADKGMEARVSSGPGLLQATDVHELSLQILEPVASKVKTGAALNASTSQATLTYSTFRVQATIGTEKGGRKGNIHITKEATPLIAKQGDTITFTIHFRNPGDYNVHDVRIIDNLTPRLRYLDDSSQIEVVDDSGGSLSVVPNKEGSQTLIFELDEPLKGGMSGTITFQAEVR